MPIDFDCYKGQIYWTDNTGGSIWRSNYNGTNKELFLSKSDGLEYPEGMHVVLLRYLCKQTADEISFLKNIFFYTLGIAIDWISRNVYWVDSGKRTIEVANMETKGKKKNFTRQLIYEVIYLLYHSFQAKKY